MSRQALDLMNKAQELTQRIDILEKGKCDCPAGKCDCKNCPECGKKMSKMGCKMGGCGSKMAKGDGVFTIGDAQRRNAGYPPEPREEIDYSDVTGVPTPSMMSMNANPTDAPDMKLDEGPPRQQKRQGMRGSEGRGVKVKRPGFRNTGDMPLSDKSPRVKQSQMAKSVEAGSQPGFTTSFDSSPMGVMFLSETGGQTRNAYYTTNQYPYNAEDVANKGATSVEVSLDKLAAMLNPHEGGGVSRLDNNGVLSNNPY